MGNPLRITWYSNAPWAGTGYGVQTAQVVPRLRDAGHEVALVANYGVSGQILRWNGFDIFPAGTDPYSNDVMAPSHRAWLTSETTKPGWLVTLFDVHVLDPKMVDGLNVASWTPVDHSPVPPKVVEWARTHRTIAMSKWGQAQLADQKVTADYIPHAIEPVFRPTASTIRVRLGVPDDAFLVMVNAANKGNVPPRKAWPEMFNAFGAFQSKHPDAWLYVHTDRHGIGGLDLMLLAHATGLNIEQIRWPDQFGYKIGAIDQSELARLYSAADVLLATSMGEGFGLSVLEAQACGLPVIATNFSAQPELVGGGWLVAAQPYWDAAQAAWFAMPLVGDIVRKLGEAYDAREDREIREKAVAHAMQYDADLVFDTYWKPVLAEMEDALVVKPRAQRRAERRKKR